MNDNWNNLLKTSGQPILHNVSLHTLKEVFHDGIPGHDNSHLDSNPDFLRACGTNGCRNGLMSYLKVDYSPSTCLSSVTFWRRYRWFDMFTGWLLVSSGLVWWHRDASLCFLDTAFVCLMLLFSSLRYLCCYLLFDPPCWVVVSGPTLLRWTGVFYWYILLWWWSERNLAI